MKEESQGVVMVTPHDELPVENNMKKNLGSEAHTGYGEG